MRSAIVYLRVETEAERADLFKQSMEAIPFYAEMPLMMVFVIQEVSNLPPLRRPEFSKLIADLKSGKRAPCYFIVPRWQTLSSNAKEALYWIEALKKMGLPVLCIELILEMRKKRSTK